MVDPSYMVDTQGVPVNSANFPKGISKDALQDNPENVFVSDMEQLRKVAPEVYEKTLKSLATNIINQMKARAERLKKMIRKNLRGEN